jgi:hypothetical protein
MQTNKSEMHNSKVGLVENSPEIYGQQQGCARVQDRGTTARYAIGAARRKVDRVRCNVAVTEKPTSETKQVCQFRVRTGQSSICMLRNQKLYLLF